MARRKNTTVENNFVQGYLTERTGLNFPANAVVSGKNCVFDERGKVTRRLGFDWEDGYELVSTDIESKDANGEYLWRAAGGDGETDLVVKQKGDFIYFFDASDSSGSLSASRLGTVLDIKVFDSPGAVIKDETVCGFASIDGDLIIVNRGTNPVYVTYDPSSMEITATEFEIMIRDFQGLTDDFDLTTRPSDSLSSLITDHPSHYYNLLNQGWAVAGNQSSNPLLQWDAARSDMPSNADVWIAYRDTDNDSFDPGEVTDKDSGNRQAPKGHFIIKAFEKNRDEVIDDAGWSSLSLGTSPVFITPDTDEIIGDFNTNSDQNAFDGDESESSGSAAKATLSSSETGIWIGQTLPSSKAIHQVQFNGSTNRGYRENNLAYSAASVTVSLLGKAGSAPSGQSDGTVLGSISFSTSVDESALRTITSSDTTTEYDHVWIRIVFGDTVSNGAGMVGEVKFYEAVENSTNVEEISGFTTILRPTTCEAFAGRVWYAGVASQGFNSNIYFSQIIERKEQYGQCYQNNDPTALDFPDLLPDDGGVVTIPAVGKVVKLWAIQGSLLVFATNGVWAIGGGDNVFTASNYSVSKLSGVGTQSDQSFVDVGGVPYFWGEEGIYRVVFNPENPTANSLTVQSITEQTIKEFVNNIPKDRKKYVKGAFDSLNTEIVWLYNEDTVTDTTRWHYNKALVYNPVSNAFYTPWETDSSAVPKILGVVGLPDSEFTGSNRLKYFVMVPEDSSNEYITCAETKNTNYFDWEQYASDESDTDLEKDYDSDFITGYRVSGEGNRYADQNYVSIFMDTQTDASVLVQGVFDWANSGNSGKWSRKQQGYHSTVSNKDISIRRLKVRGRGRSLQLRFSSETRKPFTLIGWSTWETQNADI